MERPHATETYAGGVAGALTGLAIWLISTYAYGGGNLPAPVGTAVYVVLPAIITGAVGFFTRRSSKLPEPVTPTPVPAGD